MINKQPYILSDTWKFNTFANKQILREKFKIWQVDPFFDTIFITLSLYVLNLSYLEDKSFCFTKFIDSGIKELTKILIRLDTAAIILKTDDQDLSNLIHLEVEWANEKNEKNEKYQ